MRSCGWHTQKSGQCDEGLKEPPRAPYFQHLLSRERRAAEREATRSLKGPPINVIINNGPSPSVTSSDTFDTNSTRSSSISAAHVHGSDSDLEDDAPLRIGDALARMHEREPDANFPQYEGALRQQGVFYASYLLDMKDRTKQSAFLVEKVKMAEGCVPAFIRRIEKEVRAHKTRRLEKSRAQPEPEGNSPANRDDVDQ